jgi:hypothetical protein
MLSSQIFVSENKNFKTLWWLYYLLFQNSLISNGNLKITIFDQWSGEVGCSVWVSSIIGLEIFTVSLLCSMAAEFKGIKINILMKSLQK